MEVQNLYQAGSDGGKPEEFLKAGRAIERRSTIIPAGLPNKPYDGSSLVMHGPPQLGGPVLTNSPFPGDPRVEQHHKLLVPPAPASDGKRGPTIEDIVRMVSSMMQVDVGGEFPPSQVYQIVHSLTGKAADRVKLLESRSGITWDNRKRAETFQGELYELAKVHLNLVYGTLGDKYLGGALYEGPVTSGLASGAADGSWLSSTGSGSGSGGGTNSGSGIGSGGIGNTGDDESNYRLVYTRVNIASYNRNSIGTGPNVIQTPLSLASGLAITEYAFARIYCVSLLEVSVNFSPLFTERGDGVPFYLGIDELSNMYNKQSDGAVAKGHFKCSATPSSTKSTIRIDVLTHKINYPSPISVPGTITVRFFDEQKLPMVLEQDMYPIDAASIAIDIPNQRIIFTLPPHDIRNGDRILLRGITCVEDANMFNDDKRYRAQVVDITHVAIFAWRAAPYTITTAGGTLIDANNAVRVSLEVAHEIN